MSDLTPEQYAQSHAAFLRALAMCNTRLSAEATREIEHWLQHDELELAFESLGLSIMREQVTLSSEVREALFPLGLLLGLDRESVLSSTFWRDFCPLLRP
jgi:hypothetical protein